MSRRPRKNHLKRLLTIIIVAFAIYISYGHFYGFNPEELVKKSELGNANFSTNVVEITSPKNGIKAYLFEDNTNPIISVKVLFAGAGIADDDEGYLGAAGITAQMMTEGAGSYSSQEFKEEMENNAISISYSVTKNDFVGGVLTLKENASKAWELFKLTLSVPRIEAKDLNRIKENTLIAIDSQSEKPQTKLSLLAAEKIYGNHPYALNPLGKAEDIKKFTDEDIGWYFSTRLAKNNLIVGIAGDINQDDAKKLLDDLFGELPQEAQIKTTQKPIVDYTTRADIEDNLPQTLFYIAAKSTPRLAPDFYPLYIANYILGGSGLNSRLNQTAREKEGLTYGIYTGLTSLDKVDMIVGGFSSTPDNAARLQEVVLAEWKKFGLDGATKKELNEAKEYLVSSYNLRFADITSIADMLVYMQKDNLGIDFLIKRNSYVEAVTLDDVNDAAAKYYNPNELIIISLGKFNKQGDNK